MSRRFGRNQRRRAREAIAAQQDEIASMNAVLVKQFMEAARRAEKNARLEQAVVNLRAANDKAQEIIANVIKALPRHSSAAPAQDLEVEYWDPDYPWRLPLPPRWDEWWQSGEMEKVGAFTMNFIEAYAMTASADHDPLRQCLWFRAKYKDAGVGYRITMEALREWPDDRALQEVTRMMAEAFVRDLEAKGIRLPSTRPRSRPATT